jgi:hypothetical protein
MLRDHRSSRALRRRLLRELGPSAIRVEAVGTHELRALRRGWLRDLDRPPLEPLRAVEAERDEREPEVVALHWIEILLVGEDDQPIPGARYQIELPDGRVRAGRLGADGLARVDGIEKPGDCKVTFPDLDQDAWRSA